MCDPASVTSDTASGTDEPARSPYRTLLIVLAGQVVIGAALLIWVALGRPVPGLAGPERDGAGLAPRAKVNHFDGARAWRLLERQVKVYGPRPAGSDSARRLADDLMTRLPGGHIDELPEGAITVFSAHGVSPAVHSEAERRGLRTIDATCPLVTKVHREAIKFASDGYTIILIGHAGHEEVEGTMGEAPESIVLVETEDDVNRLEVADPDKLAYISQTTLSVDETRQIISRLRERFPNITGPRTDDICYATTNRQAAVKELAPHCDLVLVLGSQNSSNSKRLVEVAKENGAESYLIDGATEVQEQWLEGVSTIGITSGASAPEELVERLVAFLRERGAPEPEDFEVLREDVRFMLPKEIRKGLAAAAER
jgi:4-hydroxy-3-methylbut-2-enyl diphosphate reductase